MDSLLATYASSDDENDDQPPLPPPQKPHPPPSSKPTSSLFAFLPKPHSSSSNLFSSLPPPKPSSSSSSSSSSNLFSSLPPPKPSSSSSSSNLFSSLPPPKPSSLFSLLPPPIAQTPFNSSLSLLPNPNPNPKRVVQSHPPQSNKDPNFRHYDDEKEHQNDPKRDRNKNSQLGHGNSVKSLLSSIPPPNPKRVVQFHPPKFNKDPNFRDDADDEEEEENDEERERKNTRQMSHDTSVKSFLSSIPAPKNSGVSALGATGSGRRLTIDTSIPASDSPDPVYEAGVDQNVEGSQVNVDDGSHLYNYDVGYGNYEGYGGYESYGEQYYDGNSWNYSGNDGVLPGEMVQGTSSSGVVDSFVSMGGGKRRKDQLPAEIVEVKQDELMKNRPTEDKSKLTGLAFGPSYQPASSKGKPSKLHKRKHQIGSLYFDMRQKEMELAERRAKGFLTKSETQAKYGW